MKSKKFSIDVSTFFLKLQPFVIFEKFWISNPALLCSLILLISTYASFKNSYILIIPIFFLSLSLLPVLYKKKHHPLSHTLIFSLVTATLVYFVNSYQYSFPPLSSSGEFGTANIEIHSIFPGKNHFSNFIVYQGIIKRFQPQKEKNSEIHNIPYSLYLPNRKNLPTANKAYEIQGTLKKNPHRNTYFLKVKKDSPWIPIENTWSLAQWRHQSKKSVQKYIKKHIHHPPSSNFLTGLVTGEFNDRITSFQFNKLGLQHIMAISGFHFSIISSLLCIFFHLFSPPRLSCILLIFSLSTYYIFLGCTPSIQRSWISCFIFLISRMINRRSNPLNTLGIAMITILLFTPLYYENLGFHFSFLATASILLFYESLDHFLEKIIHKLPLSTVAEFTHYKQYSYLFSSFLRKGLSLMLSVNLTALPIMLYYFHKFPWTSLLYNLFFPFLVSISLFLLLLSFLFNLIFPPLENFLHWINTTYTQLMLEICFKLPPSFNLVWRVKSFPEELFISYLCIIFFLGVLLKSYVQRQSSTSESHYAQKSTSFF